MRTSVIVTLLLGVPRAVLACPVCFGQNDSPIATAMNAGIVAMLIVVVAVLVAFASFFVHLMRRANLVARREASGPAPSGVPLDARGGTARC